MLDLNTIYSMDCLVGMQQIPDRSIDICVTSLPYNIGIDYGVNYDDNMPVAAYVEFLDRVGVEIRRVLKDDGSFFLNLGFALRDPTVPFKVIDRLSTRFVVQNVITWVKSISVNDTSYGHYKPVNSNRYHYGGFEYLFHLTKTGTVSLDKVATGVPYKDKTNIARWKTGADTHDRGNVWFIPYPTVKSAKPHPAAFPFDLPLMCIKDHGYTKNTVVLDPFMGSGTTALAAQRLGCAYIGFEINGDPNP